jgi:hypothetical protein
MGLSGSARAGSPLTPQMKNPPVPCPYLPGLLAQFAQVEVVGVSDEVGVVVDHDAVRGSAVAASAAHLGEGKGGEGEAG